MNTEKRNKYTREYNKRPEAIAWRKKYRQRPEVRAKRGKRLEEQMRFFKGLSSQERMDYFEEKYG